MPIDTELRFARHITNLVGWMTVAALTEDEDATVADWRRRGLPVEKTSGQLEPRRIVELTDAGRAWCRDNGVA